MKRTVIVASLEFPNKKSAKQYFRDIRDRYSDGERLSEEDEGYLRDLVAIHPEARMKVGVGISYFTVETDPVFKRTRHFMIHRTDGSSTDVSFLSPFDGRNERKDRLEALRRAIEDQILEFRRSSFESGESLVCPLRNIAITEEAYHIDHEPPRTFLWLAKEWLKSSNLKLASLEITPPADNQYVTVMTNVKQIESWREFHRENCRLRLLSPRANLSDSSKS